MGAGGADGGIGEGISISISMLSSSSSSTCSDALKLVDMPSGLSIRRLFRSFCPDLSSFAGRLLALSDPEGSKSNATGAPVFFAVGALGACRVGLL